MSNRKKLRGRPGAAPRTANPVRALSASPAAAAARRWVATLDGSHHHADYAVPALRAVLGRFKASAEGWVAGRGKAEHCRHVRPVPPRLLHWFAGNPVMLLCSSCGQRVYDEVFMTGCTECDLCGAPDQRPALVSLSRVNVVMHAVLCGGCFAPRPIPAAAAPSGGEAMCVRYAP